MNNDLENRVEETKEVNVVSNVAKKKKKKAIDIFAVVTASFLVLAHIAVILAVINSYQYYDIYPSIFISVVAIVVCLLIISDIVFFVGFNHKDLGLKIITIVLAVLIFVGGTVGTYLLIRVNGSLGNIINTGEDKYELVSGVFTYYDSDYEIKELEDLKGLNVGFVKETTRGIATIAQEKLEALKIDYALVDKYNNNLELLLGLINGDVAVAVFPNGYPTLFTSDENNDYSSYMNKMVDFYSFEEQVKVNQKTNNKNLSKEPFNVLLIGWSRTDIGSSVGLADAIIVATINPQTYTASLMSIARDSYVDIPCYGNTKDKINSGRSTSRACFIETVEQLLGTEMDFYMEIDYFAIVNAVNAIGGIEITNPVEFTLDGQFVPEGTFVADGYQVLQFVRERHHMPNGDFDRQQHQKEVIMAIARKLIESRDVTMALDAFNAASDLMSTDLTLKQLTEIFNMILNTKNYTGLDTFSLLDFQTSRITGYASWHYSYDYGIPLWIYKLYDGSIKESLEHMNEVLGNYERIEQDRSFSFSGNNPYIRPSFSSSEFDEKEDHEVMPAFFPHLDTMTYQEALEWCTSNNITVELEFIYPGDAKYVESLDGMVINQSVRYGALLSENSRVKLTVMGAGDTSKIVPNFVGRSLNKVFEWASDHYYSVKFDWIENNDSSLTGKVADQDLKPGTMADEHGGTITVNVYDGYISDSELSKLIIKTETVKGTKYKDVMDWVKNNLYYDIATNGEVGELLSYSCDDSKIKFSTRGCKFNFSDGKTTKNKDYSELTEAEKALATIEWTDIDGEGSVGACSLLYINDELDSVTCSGTRQRCGEHEERDSNGACQFKPYSYTSSSCEGISNPTTEDIGYVEGATLVSTTYEITYTAKDVAACKITNTYQAPEPPAEQPTE